MLALRSREKAQGAQQGPDSFDTGPTEAVDNLKPQSYHLAEAFHSGNLRANPLPTTRQERLSLGPSDLAGFAAGEAGGWMGCDTTD